MDQLGTIAELITPTVFLSIMAFWKQKAVLFLLAAAAAIVAGLAWRPEFPGYAGLTNGLVLIGYGIVCLGFALKHMIWGKDDE